MAHHEIKFDVVGIGNALVDILAETSDDSLVKLALAKGGMQLIGTDDAERITVAMPNARQVSGGSGANTAAGLASLGGRAAYIGKVATDALGRAFEDDLTKAGVHFFTKPLVIAKADAVGAALATGRCLVLVTPDAERTMCTYLGASNQLTEDDIDENVVASSRVCYLEGYLFDPPSAKHAFYKAAQIARAHNRKVALSLSDLFCVERHRDDFLRLIEKDVDLVFANKTEMLALYQIDDLNVAIERMTKHVELICVTDGAGGSIIAGQDARITIAAAPADLIDTTGAGDLYAAGFLYGYARDLPLEECGRIAALAAAEVISHMGARPETELKTLI